MSFIFSNSLMAPHTHVRGRNLNMAWKGLLWLPTSNIQPINLLQWLHPVPKICHSLPSFHSQLPNLHLIWVPLKAFLTWSGWFYHSSLYIPTASFVTLIITDITIISLFFSLFNYHSYRTGTRSFNHMNRILKSYLSDIMVHSHHFNRCRKIICQKSIYICEEKNSQWTPGWLSC